MEEGTPDCKLRESLLLLFEVVPPPLEAEFEF